MISKPRRREGIRSVAGPRFIDELQRELRRHGLLESASGEGLTGLGPMNPVRRVRLFAVYSSSQCLTQPPMAATVFSLMAHWSRGLSVQAAGWCCLQAPALCSFSCTRR